MRLDYKDACVSILTYLSRRYALETLIWLERRGERLNGLFALGRLADKSIKIGITADNERLLEAAKREIPLELKERGESGSGATMRTLNLFPVIIGSDILGAIGVEAEIENSVQRRDISRLAQTVASPLEILRLRDEVSQRDWLSRAVKRFNESLKKIDADDFWLHITQISAELLGAERASILIQSEKSNSLHAKAAIGSRINLLAEDSVGVRVARLVLNGGTPVVVSDMETVGLELAPLEWRYKTSSFISYPILIGERKIGVLNFTDRAGGNAFNEHDLELLQAIAPQIAVAIDRTTMKDKAGEYEQLSVTDALTGLLNRRYIEERLAEEIMRSLRHRFPMSLMMLDVDNFKSYNDSYGHPAGDAALEIVAEVLKETLRGDDVAARYGGEEFAILLPQTSCEEAAPIAERIRQRIERTKFPKRKVTVSIGIAEFSRGLDSPKDLISAADVALYEAKNHGRNNVQIFSNLDNSLTENIH
jgi:diguanylate cyclase (GGDEF)-like protein